MKILVIGRSGQLARALSRRATEAGHAIVTLGRPAFDLEQPDSLRALAKAFDPNIIINTAAYTAVDKAEREHNRAFAINANGAGAVADVAAELGVGLIHISTDYVFSGEKRAPYVETDSPSPKNVYGASKLEGERRVLAAHPNAIVVRPSWIYDATGTNFVRTMLRLAQSRTDIRVVSDQLGCPTYAPDLADALLAIAASCSRFGIYHCAGQGETNWSSFAEAVFDFSRALDGPSAAVQPIPASEYATAAARPANSRLDCSKIARDYNVRMPHWRVSLGACIDTIAAGDWSLA